MPLGSIIKRNNVNVLGNENADQTLLFANGFGTDQRIWHPLISSFTDDYKIVLFDYVGANEATVPYFNIRRYKQLYSFADDLLDIVDELKLSNITLVGHSVGGMSGILAAVQEPSWFSKLALLNASPRYVNQADYVGGFDQEALDGLFEQMEGNFHAWVSGFAMMIAANPDRPQVARAFAQTLADMRPDVALAIAKVIFCSDHRADIERLQHPTLLLQAKRDPAVPEFVSHYLESHIPNATLNLLECEGHFPHMSDTGHVITAVKAFLN